VGNGKQRRGYTAWIKGNHPGLQQDRESTRKQHGTGKPDQITDRWGAREGTVGDQQTETDHQQPVHLLQLPAGTHPQSEGSERDHAGGPERIALSEGGGDREQGQPCQAK